jgi:hypothetical protein
MRSVYIDMEYFSKISHRNSLLISNYIPAEKCANAGVVKMEKFQNERLEFLHFFLWSLLESKDVTDKRTDISLNS